MQRRQFFASAAIGAASALVAAPAVAQAAPQVRWRVRSTFPKELDVIRGAAELFARSVEQASEGRFTVEIEDGAPGEAAQALEDVAAGRLDIALATTNAWLDKDPAFGLLTGAPFGLNARQQNAWFYEAGGLDLANAFLGRHGLAMLPAGNTGAQMGGWFRREIKNPAELSGLKVRIGGLGGEVMRRLGAETVPMAANELATGFEQAKLDAAEWIGPYDDEKLGLTKAAPFYYYPGWWAGGATIALLFNKDRWAELPKPYHAMAEAAAALASLDMTAKYDARNPGALRRIVGSGVQLRLYPQEIQEAAYRAANAMGQEFSARNAEYRTLWDSIRAFRGEEYLWFQVAEYPFDNFMIRARAKSG